MASAAAATDGDRDSHYEVLGVSSQATSREIKEAYRELAKSLHPDKNKYGAVLFKRINEAHAILSDPATRRTYDASSTRTSASGTGTSTPRRGRQPSPTTNEEEDKGDKSLRHKILSSCICTICKDVVQNPFLESPCCGCLACLKCLKAEYPGYHHRENRVEDDLPCPSCVTPRSVSFRHSKRTFGWNQSIRFAETVMDGIAPPCRLCGKRIHPKNALKHRLVCPCG